MNNFEIRNFYKNIDEDRSIDDFLKWIKFVVIAPRKDNVEIPYALLMSEKGFWSLVSFENFIKSFYKVLKAEFYKKDNSGEIYINYKFLLNEKLVIKFNSNNFSNAFQVLKQSLEEIYIKIKEGKSNELSILLIKTIK